MKKINIIFCTSLALSLTIGLAINYQRLAEQARNYTINALEKTYGAQPLDPKRTALVQSIAAEMGISKPIKICKMNTLAMQQFGYCNAFAVTPLFLDLIPISSQPYMYISESFFADITPAEQRFLIGHELIHIRDQHVDWLNFGIAILQIIGFIIFWLLIKPLRQKLSALSAHMQTQVNSKLSKLLLIKILIILAIAGTAMLTIGLIPSLLGLTYRRYVEREADCRSLELLNSHEGALKFMCRAEQSYSSPQHNPYFGLLSDHPSCHERRIYCLESQVQKEYAQLNCKK
ncbi:MAG TPA: M48 family metalloprotease [Candidatus Babeliales bacterium]|nr:M48 family metalloprotease [Candidatus Babeliales bacterium]